MNDFLILLLAWTLLFPVCAAAQTAASGEAAAEQRAGSTETEVTQTAVGAEGAAVRATAGGEVVPSGKAAVTQAVSGGEGAAVRAAAGGEGAVFWRYAQDRYKRPALLEPLAVPEGREPYEFLASFLGFADWHVSRRGEGIVLSEKAVNGEIPVLCFHKIGRQERFAITPERFRRLLRYLKQEGWYLVSDYQYLQGDFSRVPTGFKPIVMGADDGGSGNIEYQVSGDSLTGSIKPFADGPRMERNSMAAILEKLAPREEGRINFTFYISFDAVPFRQLGGERNPGFPYGGISLVEKKIRYLDKHFIVGIHSLSHEYVYRMGVEAFVRDILAAWEMIDTYAGGRAETLHTMAFPYGVGDLTADVHRKLSTLSRGGRTLAGAFDLDGMYAGPPGNPGNLFDVSRINVDNENWDFVMSMLENADAVEARRDIIWVSRSKRLPPSPYRLGAAPSDRVWVLVLPEGPVPGSS